VPLAIYVEPEGVQLGDACGPDVPRGCFPVVPTTSDYTVSLPAEQVVDNGQRVSSLTFKRKGYLLADAYAVTDYFCQGMSFGKADWVAQFIPPKNNFCRASLYVMLSRFRDWEAVKLLSPLWPAGDATAREAVIRAYYMASRMSGDLQAELQRQAQEAAKTRERHADLFRKHEKRAPV
jgi:hypothetical protein